MRFDATGSRSLQLPQQVGNRPTIQLGPECKIDRRQLGNDAFEPLEIEAGTPDDQRNDSALIQHGDRLTGQKAVFLGVAQIR